MPAHAALVSPKSKKKRYKIVSAWRIFHLGKTAKTHKKEPHQAALVENSECSLHESAE
jgi:hypothetical protein